MGSYVGDVLLRGSPGVIFCSNFSLATLNLFYEYQDLCLHFLPFPIKAMVQVVEILPHGMD